MKKCTKCNIEKNLNEFNKNKKNKKTGLSAYCKECVRSFSKQDYIKNKEIRNEQNKIYKQEYRKWYEEYKKCLSCIKCGENHIACLEFHHTNPKIKDIAVGTMISKGWKKEKIINEINKCIVLCANCHRKEHFN